ncbi:MAG: hypothetical protein MI757_02745, partial [Pirellulales bacterium]|nr:hypothetical protein [Pirellulales bacterium]
HGQSDKLLGDELSLHFARRDDGEKPARPGMPTGMILASIEAQGRPVIVNSPSTETDVRCQSLRFDIKENRLRLAGQSGVWLKREGSEVTAASIDYTAAKNGRLGDLLAIGPGRIDAKLGKKRDQSFAAEWKERLQIQPFKNHKVVSLVGNARSSNGQWGTLAADELHLYLSEIENTQPNLPEDKKTNKRVEIRPDAFKAVGQVQIDSLQLVGSTQDLVLWIEHLPPSGEAINAEPEPRNAFDRRPSANDARPKDRYKIHGDKIQAQLIAEPRGPDGRLDAKIANVVIKERAYFAEVPAPGDNRDEAKQPLVVRGTQLNVENANSPDMVVSVMGQPAHIEARGMSLDGAQIHMDRAKNQMWIDRAGKLTLPVNRDLDGQPLSSRDRLSITWTGEMTFDGMTMNFRENVSASTAHQSLATDAMAVTMTRRVNFGESQSRQKVDVHAVRCRGQVRLQAETLDKKGQRESWLRAVADNLAIEQSTGRLMADGPGWVKIVRRGAVDTSRLTGSPANRSTAVSDRLSYLGVDFQRGVSGNILPGRRQLTFSDQVKTVFGPVERWADELDTARKMATRPENVLLSCDKLTVSQSPASHGRPESMDLVAEGDTRVDGNGFAAMASRLSYAEGKDLLILDSDGLSDAKLYRDDDSGGRSEMAARQIHYWPRSQKFRVFGARSVKSVAGRP